MSNTKKMEDLSPEDIIAAFKANKAEILRLQQDIARLEREKKRAGENEHH